MIIKIRPQAGFTLVELVVTITLITIVAGSITQLFVSVQRVQLQTAYQDTAGHAAQTEIETLRNSSYNSLTPGQNIDFTSSLPSNLPDKSGTVVVSQPADGLRRVDVTVSYRYLNATRSVQLSSLIGVIGITK
jgi:prepilin-type N-terminal cleavage/methylation domain-containing protein